MIILKSTFQTEALNIKDMLLNKKSNDHNLIKTTESFFNLENQPHDTCPLIDKSIEEVEKLLLILVENEDILSKIFSYKSEGEHCSCHNKVALDDNLGKLKDFRLANSLNKDEVLKLLHPHEDLRANCVIVREKGEKIKSLIWNTLDEIYYEKSKNDNEEKILKLIEDSKYDLSKLSEIERLDFSDIISSLLDDLSTMIIPEDLLIEECQNQCSSYLINKKIIDLSSDLKSLNEIAVYEEAQKNYDLIINWTQSLATIFNQLFEDQGFASYIMQAQTQEEISIKKLNSDQIAKFIDWIQNSSFDEDLSNIINYVENVKNNSQLVNEDLIKNKKIDKISQALISDLKELDEKLFKMRDFPMNNWEDEFKVVKNKLLNIDNLFIEFSNLFDKKDFENLTIQSAHSAFHGLEIEIKKNGYQKFNYLSIYNID